MSENKRSNSVRTTTNKVLLKIAMLSLLVATAFTAITGCEIFTPGLGQEIDITSPVVIIMSHVDVETVSGTVVLFGTMGENTSIQDVTLSIEAEVMVPVIYDNNWQIKIATERYVDGPKHICVIVTDHANKTAEANVLLNFRNFVPASSGAPSR